MAEILSLPKEVINSEREDDVDVDYAIYGDNEKTESEYTSPEAVSKESISKIEARKIGHDVLNMFTSDKVTA